MALTQSNNSNRNREFEKHFSGIRFSYCCFQEVFRAKFREIDKQPSYQVAQVALWELDKKSGRGRM